MTWTGQTNGVAGWTAMQGFGAGQYGDQMYGEETSQSWLSETFGNLGWNLNVNGLGVGGLGVLGLGQIDNQAGWSLSTIYNLTWS